MTIGWSGETHRDLETLIDPLIPSRGIISALKMEELDVPTVITGEYLEAHITLCWIQSKMIHSFVGVHVRK